MVGTKHMLVHFQGKVIEAIVTNMASAVDEWVRDVRSIYTGHGVVVGLDCEWKPNTISSMSNRTATLQLCIDTKCLIVQMFYLDYIPQSLKAFLSDPNLTFVGVEVGDDVLKLLSEYGLVVTSTADIQALAMARWPVRFYRKPGLKDLASYVAGLNMEKPMHVCRSNWEVRYLSEEQVEYACIDAYASCKIGHQLLKEV